MESSQKKKLKLFNFIVATLSPQSNGHFFLTRGITLNTKEQLSKSPHCFSCQSFLSNNTTNPTQKKALSNKHQTNQVTNDHNT